MRKNKKAGDTGFLVLVRQGGLSVLRQRLDALGAELLTDQFLAFAHRHCLDVRVELPAGCAHREAALVTKLRLLTTRCTHGHGRCYLDFA
jgi:hypothetical protein